MATDDQSPLARELAKELEGEVLFDAFSRGRYSTDASIYQIEPIGVVIPKSEQDVARAIQIAAEHGVPLLPRGAGTSQCGQTVGRALVLDFSKHLARTLRVDAEARTALVEPGVVLDRLNAELAPRGLFFPVDVSTSAQATIGGMTGNNSCGSRSIRYGNMVHNVRSVKALMADGEALTFAAVPGNLSDLAGPRRYSDLVEACRRTALRVRVEEHPAWPKLLRRVGGYNLDSVDLRGHNMARLLVGSEGTLATFTEIELDLHRIPPHKALGVCHFPTFYRAMAATQHIVALDPSAVELVDRTMVELAREIPVYADAIGRFVRGEPEAILLVEFAGETLAEPLAKLDSLDELLADLGFPDSLVRATDPAFQAEIWEVRKAGLNIMMSMKGDGKPVSFIEDCAVPLEDLAEYTDRLTRVFEKHGTAGTWYAHASVGCLHVRPVLNMKDEGDVAKMRAIAEEAFAMVREYKGSHSGEHGDGLVRSEFHEPMFGREIAEAFSEIKHTFDPRALMNPGKIVHASRMDDRSLFRFKPGYRARALRTALDWSEWGGFPGAVEMCNNNGACRKAKGVMCPSYRATRDEQHLTRGRANTLRLALSGQLGEDGFSSPALYETMALCVGCKGCKRECPTGVDMTRMKTEFLYHYHQRHPRRLRDRLLAHLPRYAPWAARARWLLNGAERVPALKRLSERALGISAHRPLPAWHADLRDAGAGNAIAENTAVLLADTFNRWFEPENVGAAREVLEAAGYRVVIPRPKHGGRPLCCGRTFLSYGMIDEAREEARRLVEALEPYLERDVPVIGLEPACLLTLRDEHRVMLEPEAARGLAGNAFLLEEFLAKTGKGELPLRPVDFARALVHGHCHQKAFDVMGSVMETLRRVPELEVTALTAGCCGMAGSFGYEAEHYEVSLKMGELGVLPAARSAPEDTVIVADGFSCRHQIAHGAGRPALHAARLLQLALQRDKPL